MKFPRYLTPALLMVPGMALSQAVMEPPSGFERVDFTGNDETLSCMVGGTGEPMLLLHGWPQTASEWVPVLPALSARHTVYACDLPGVRDSTNTDDDFSKAGMADDIHAALAEIGPMHVVGHDIGLMVAYAYASAFPDDVISATFMDAPLPGTEIYELILADPRSWHFAFHAVPEVPEAIVANDLEYYMDHFIRSFWGTADVDPAHTVEESVAAYSDPDTLRAGFEFYRAFPQDAEDNTAYAETMLTMPVLALSAGANSEQPYVLFMMQELAEDVSGGSIEDTGHWLTEENPDAVSAAILEFTAGLAQ